VKLFRVKNGRYIFRLEKQERDLLALLLRLYPVIPAAHQPLSKSSASLNEANQGLLDEALAEQRRENKKLVETFLADGKRFHENKTSFRMAITAADVEWLLQMLNDVRVGNWILLGSPEKEELNPLPNDPDAPRVWAMELAALLQMNLLRAVNEPPGSDVKAAS
jgi:hypothetical protein